jgi:4-hydroxy-tetrahydrodipicolinate reductase
VRVVVVGYGKMGREVEAVVRERGHEAVCIDVGAALPQGCAVGIDFTQPEAVVANVEAAMRAGLRYVVGTTGWFERLAEVSQLVTGAGGGLVYSANFSLGVNLYFRVVKQAAALMARFNEYDPYVTERHHRQKKDAPSGTAKVLAEILERSQGPRRRAEIHLDGAIAPDAFHVSAVRAGGIVGDHTVGWDSGTDEILIEHRARSRRGFALGSVLAAEWLREQTGCHSFEGVLDELLGQ